MNNKNCCKLKRVYEAEVLHEGKPFLVKSPKGGEEVRALLGKRLKEERFPIFKGRRVKVRQLDGRTWEIVSLLCTPWEVSRRVVPVGFQYEVVQSLKALHGEGARLWYPSLTLREVVLDATIHALKTRHARTPRLEAQRGGRKRLLRGLPVQKMIWEDASSWALLSEEEGVLGCILEHKSECGEEILWAGDLKEPPEDVVPLLSGLLRAAANPVCKL